MANFDDQIMGLTGLTISGSSTAPSQTELSTFLNDGVMDVTNRCLILDPRMATDFTRESAETTSNTSTPLDLNGAQIISVVREADTNNDWRNCRIISPALQSRAVDSESLHFASIYNPVYTVLENGIINVYPAPDTGGSKSFKVYYVNNAPEETDGTALIHSSSGIKYFPSNKIYLVILYASMRSLLSAMGATIASFGSYGVPTLNQVQSSTPNDLVHMLDGDWVGLDYDFDDENIEFNTWFQVLGDMIQNQEDIELATAQIQKITAFLQAYSQAMTNSTNKQADNVDKLVKDYTWMSDRYDKLNLEYYGYFKDIQDKKAQQQQAQQQAMQQYAR